MNFHMHHDIFLEKKSSPISKTSSHIFFERNSLIFLDKDSIIREYDRGEYVHQIEAVITTKVIRVSIDRRLTRHPKCAVLYLCNTQSRNFPSLYLYQCVGHMETMYGSLIGSITQIRQAIFNAKQEKDNFEHVSYLRHISKKVHTRLQKNHDFREKDVYGCVAENMIYFLAQKRISSGKYDIQRKSTTYSVTYKEKQYPISILQ